VALADRDGDALRRRRRPAGRRGRRPVRLPGERAADEALRLYPERRGDRRLQPRPRRPLQRRRARLVAAEARPDGAARAGGGQPAPGLRRDPPARRRHGTRGEVDRRREVDAGADHDADPFRSEALAAPEGLPRARAGPLLGDVVHVHRRDLQDVRLQEHRGRGRLVPQRLPAALGRVHRRRESRHRRPRRYEMLRPDRQDRRRSAGLGERLGGEAPPGDQRGRRHRLAVGAADRRLRPARRERGEAVVDALAGSAYQGVFRNPLADPYLLGVAAGAGLGATLAIAYGSGGSVLLPLAAFGGASLGVACAYVLGRSVGGARTTGTLILAGVTVAAFMTSLQTFVQQQRSQTLREVYSWLLGGLGTAEWHDVALAAPYVVVSSILILLHRRVLDVLSVGDEEASALGLDVRRVRLLIVAAATAGTAAAVAVSGLIGFVGIIVPHTIRLLVSTSYRAVVPLSLVVGAGFLVLTDVLARTILSPAELPIGVVTAFFGAPFFAVVLRTSKSVR